MIAALSHLSKPATQQQELSSSPSMDIESNNSENITHRDFNTGINGGDHSRRIPETIASKPYDHSMVNVSLLKSNKNVGSFV
jgi:hypothetical protein